MSTIYHGTIIKNLTGLEPRKRYTPGDAAAADAIGPRIYATYNPAFAVAHSFPWSSEDGIDIQVKENGTISIIVPKDKTTVLNQEICIYSLPDDTFVPTTEEETGLTYHSEVAVPVHECVIFPTVTAGIEAYGGQILFI